MRSALANGQVDAIWTPEPFLSQAINIDGARTVMAPGPGARQVLADRRLLRPRPTGCGSNPRRGEVPHGDEPVAGLRAVALGRDSRAAACGVRNVRLPIWTPSSTGRSCSQLAKYAKKYGVISTLPNITQLVPSTINGGKTLQGTVGDKFITLRQDGKAVTG